VAEALELDTMVLVVAGDPWQKSATSHVTGAVHRLAMTRLAVQDIPGLEVSDIETRRQGPSYMVDTIGAMSAPGQRMVLVLGADAAAGLHTWQRPEELLSMVDLVVVDRGDAAHGDGGLTQGCTRVAIPRLDISSTDLRHRFATGRPVAGLVPVAVCDYVHHHRLYRDES
jgi:nicotinate-nucleotide adenylyltransferase